MANSFHVTFLPGGVTPADDALAAFATSGIVNVNVRCVRLEVVFADGLERIGIPIFSIKSGLSAYSSHFAFVGRKIWMVVIIAL